MAEGGEEIPFVPKTDDHNDGDDDFDFDGDDEAETTPPFEPGPTSTPYPEGEGGPIEMHTLPKEQSGLPNTSFDENIPDFTQRLQQRKAASAWSDLTVMYSDANKLALETFYETGKDGEKRLYVKMIGSRKKSISPAYKRYKRYILLKNSYEFKICSEARISEVCPL